MTLKVKFNDFEIITRSRSAPVAVASCSDLEGHQEIAKREWQQSGGAINFVGEWHTHPERHPTPSWIDRRSWRRQMTRPERDPLVFIIVGSAAVYCEIGVEGQLATMGRVSQ